MFLDITNKERERYSLNRAIHAQLSKNPKEAPLEYEISNYIAKETGQPARGFYIPEDIFSRDLSTSSPQAGGNLVENESLGEVIPSLKSTSQVFKLGATALNDLVGNVDIPRITTGPTLTETAENSPATKQDPVFGLVPLSPQQHSVHIDVSRKLVKQSSVSIDAFIAEEIAGVAASKIDALAMQAILNDTNVPVLPMGTNGLAPTWSKICELEKVVTAANGVINSSGWLTNHAVASKMKQVEKSTGNGFIYDGGEQLAGHSIGLSSQVPNNLSKGTSTNVCSALVFGSFDQVLVGQWAALDVVVDRYSLGVTGGVRLIVWLDVDVALRQARSFAVIKDLLTV